MIRTWDYRDEYEIEREDILAAVDRVFRSGTLILGESVRQFEAEFARFCGVAHGVGVGNGTDGLFLTLRALGIGAGDEVITVANTAVPTVSAIVATGATPRFTDIVPDTQLMDVGQLEALMGPRTRAVVPVHLFGQCVEMEAVNEIAGRLGVPVIEDCAQAHGATRHGQPAGSMSRAGVFSFYPTKPLGAYGDGGMVVTNDAELASRLRRLRFYGMKDTYCAEEDGYNSRLDEVHAEILRFKLTRLPEYVAQRRAIATKYDQLLERLPVRRPSTLTGNQHAFYLYVVRHTDRDRILQELREREIDLNISYPWPIHLMPAYRSLGYGRGDLPVTEAAASEVFSLPMYPTLTDGVQRGVCVALGHILSKPE